MGSMKKEKPDWPRVRITSVPCPLGLTLDQIHDLVLVMCQTFWAVETIPVVGWGGEFDGCECIPRIWH